MKKRLMTMGDPPPIKGDPYDPGYPQRLSVWAKEWGVAEDELWQAMALVLSAAVQQDLETPAWCRCRPNGDALTLALDLVLEALPPQGVQAFDKQQGA